MKLKPIGSNQTELEIGDYTILFSYQTPVAYHQTGVGYFRTSQHYSVTTSKHINQWFRANAANKATEVSQSDIDAIVGEGE